MTGRKKLTSFKELKVEKKDKKEQIFKLNAKNSECFGNKTIDNKSHEFLTYQDQIIKLKELGIKIDKPDSQVEQFLKSYSYFRLNKYRFDMYKDSRKFKKKFSTIQNIYLLDEKLRLLFLKYAMQLEVCLSSTIAYLLSDKYKSVSPHLKEEKLKNAITEVLSYKKWNSKNSYDYNRSIESIIISFTFGELKKFYDRLDYDCDIQGKIANSYIYQTNNMNNETALSLFKDWIDSIVNLRNKCAHSYQLLFRNYPRPKPYREVKAGGKKAQEYKEKTLLAEGTQSAHILIRKTGNSFFHILSSLKYFIDNIDKNNRMKEELEGILCEIGDDIRLEECGIPDNWTEFYPWK